MRVKPGRNDPCHCGSGKKYKKCHLPLDEQDQAEALKARKAAEAPKPPEAPMPTLAEEWRRSIPKPGAKPAEILKFLNRSGLAKRDPAFKELFDKHKTVMRYMEHQEVIEAALTRLDAYQDEFEHLLNDDEALFDRCEAVFKEDAFVPFRFTADQVDEVFKQIGPPKTFERDESQQQGLLQAINRLATEEYRSNVSMELLLLLPTYVDQDRFLDACLISYMAEMTISVKNKTNPFLSQMFYYGYSECRARARKSSLDALRQAGLDITEDMDPEEMQARAKEWMAQSGSEDRLQAILESAHPELNQALKMALENAPEKAVQLLQHRDARRLFLRLEEIEPWVPMLMDKLQLSRERYPLDNPEHRLTEAQQREAFEEIFLPAMREVAKGIFTPARLHKLVAELNAFRRDLTEAGENNAAMCAAAAITYVEPETEPAQNSFLINLCYHSMARAQNVSS